MKIYLAALETQDSNYEVHKDMKDRDVFLTYYYPKLSEKCLPKLKPLGHKGTIVMDSGAHSFFGHVGISATAHIKKEGSIKDPEQYFKDYVLFIKRWYDHVDYFVELDIQDLVGLDRVKEWRELYKKYGVYDKMILVHHSNDGMEHFKQIVQESACKYIGIEGLRNHLKTLPYNDYIKIAYQNNCKIHGFAFTKYKLLHEFPFYSVDSSSWTIGIRYGKLLKFFENEMKTIDSEKNGFAKYGISVELHSVKRDKENGRVFYKILAKERCTLGKEIIYAPIERFEGRYSKQWHEWFMKSFKDYGFEPIVVGDDKVIEIKTGQFLDIFRTNKYKLSQMYEILDHVEKGFQGTVFFMDLWYPSLESLAYVRNCAKRKIRIEGILHAGTWDTQDFLFQSGCFAWAYLIEQGWFNIIDKIYVATEFHKELILKHACYIPRLERKIEVVKFPVVNAQHFSDKRDIVVFPHRLAPEKSPLEFEKLEREFKVKYPHLDHVLFIKTMDICKTKDDYYKILASSKVAFSSAYQETFGIAMLEAENHGCICVAPNRLSYRETMLPENLYDHFEDSLDMVAKAIMNYKTPEQRYFPCMDDIVQRIQA